MKVLVCGDRFWEDRGFLEATLDALGPFDLLIEGEARGADTMAREWAISRGVPYKPFPANWDKYGKAAGPIRNQQMLDEGQPDLVVAFHNSLDTSRGTKDMVKRANAAGIPVGTFSNR